jgi:predicted nucleic acid-binding protein
MLQAISNTSPLLYLYRIGLIDRLPEIFGEIWTPEAVHVELMVGDKSGYDVPTLSEYSWLRIINPKAQPSEWLSLDLGPGELSAMSLALENSHCIVLLDDMLARRTAHAAGLKVWGTLKVLLEIKVQGFISKVEPYVNRLTDAGMWVSDDVKRRILLLAGELE